MGIMNFINKKKGEFKARKIERIANETARYKSQRIAEELQQDVTKKYLKEKEGYEKAAAFNQQASPTSKLQAFGQGLAKTMNEKKAKSKRSGFLGSINDDRPSYKRGASSKRKENLRKLGSLNSGANVDSSRFGGTRDLEFTARDIETGGSSPFNQSPMKKKRMM